MSAYGNPQPYGYAGQNGSDEYDSYGAYADAYAVDEYRSGSGRYARSADPYADSYPADPYAAPEPTVATPRGSAAVGGAPVGSASAGRARVSPVATPEPPAAPRYGWSGSEPAQPAAGRASVPVSPGTGPVGPGGASGRAAVRSGGGAGGPGGPGTPGGSGGTGPGRGQPKRKKKRHRIRNTFLSLLAAMVIIAGGGMVALSYYVDSVPPPGELPLEEASTVYFADGKEMAELEKVNREIIDTTVPELEPARSAVIAAEDKNFMEHSGVDFVGIVRAAWNNATGGATQGASTIDQQYAGAVAKTRGEDSYRRKLEEAAMAYKMNQELEKEEILDFYLNTIYFGRGAYGIQAAAEAYFGKDASELSIAEASIVAGCIRVPDDGTGLCPYDPMHTPDDPSQAEIRFQYVLTQLVDMGELTQGEADAMELPEVIEPVADDEPRKGPQGHIIGQVERELEGMGIDDLTTGGYRVTTTIDPQLQKAALNAARRGDDEGTAWDNIPDNVGAALVSIDPNSGAVRAYYGGDDGVGWDRAGLNLNEETGEWEGGREPGSTMKIYSLIAAMRNGVSFKSHWQTSEYTPSYREQPIRNAGRDARDSGCEGEAPDYCTLQWSTIKSFNAPFAHFSEALGHDGPPEIVQAAMDAGVRSMTDNDGVTHDLTAIADASEVAPSEFFHEVAFGQYQITVLDHASGVATLAARGMYHEPHFVAKVEKKIDGEWVQTHSNSIEGQQQVQIEHADAITGVLSQIPNDPILNRPLAGGRPVAAKTGTWEYDGEGGGNKDAWVVGYTPQVATAVWVGDDDGGAIADEWGTPIGSSGVPAVIWQQFMNAAHEAKGYEHAQFPPAPDVGNPQTPLANGIEPEPEEDDNFLCRGRFQPPFCDNNGENNGGGGNEGGGNEGGGGILPQPSPDPDELEEELPDIPGQ